MLHDITKCYLINTKQEKNCGISSFFCITWSSLKLASIPFPTSNRKESIFCLKATKVSLFSHFFFYNDSDVTCTVYSEQLNTHPNPM